MLTRELIANVRRIEIRTRRRVDALTAGAYHSVFKGSGIEFAEVRTYASEDDARLIDWNVTARFGHPFVKQFVEERELVVLLAVDVSGSHDTGRSGRDKHSLATELAALLAFSAVRNNDRVGLLLYSDREELSLPPRKGRRHALRLVRELVAFQPRSRGTDTQVALDAAMRRLPRHAIVFLISDLLDSGFETRLRAVARKHDVVVLRLIEGRTTELPKAGLLAVEDAESGQWRLLDSGSNRTRTAYSAAHARFRKNQGDVVTNIGVDIVDICLGEEYMKPLLDFFHRRSKRR